MSTIIEVTAEDEETIERNVSDAITLCASMDMVCKRADYKHEQGFCPHCLRYRLTLTWNGNQDEMF